MSSNERPDSRAGLVASLLDAGRQEAPEGTDALEARILAAAGYAGVATPAPRSLLRRALRLLGAKGVVGVGIVVLAAGGVALLHRHHVAVEVAQPLRAVATSPIPTTAPAPPAIAPRPASSIAVEVTPIEALPLVRAPSAPAAATAPPAPALVVDTVPAPTQPSDTVGAEAAALEHARGTFNGSDANGTLRELDAFQRRFPQPLLAEEAAFLRVRALDRAGRGAEARASAAAFVARYPGSPYASRAAEIAHADVKESP